MDLAEYGSEGFITLKDIAARQNISKKYLEQIIPFLTRSKLLLSNKGHGGGYKISRKPEDITVLEILESAEGSLVPVNCMEDNPIQCSRCNECRTLPIYQGLYSLIVRYLGGISLLDAVEGRISSDFM